VILDKEPIIYPIPGDPRCLASSFRMHLQGFNTKYPAFRQHPRVNWCGSS